MLYQKARDAIIGFPREKHESAPVKWKRIGKLNDMKNKIFIALLNFMVVGACVISSPAQTSPATKMNVAILIFDGVQIIDYTGPYEVLGSRGRRNVYTVAEKPDVIKTNMGMLVVPNYTFANQPKPDILIIPGGGNIIDGKGGRGVGAQLSNQNVLNWIKDNARDAKYVMSVCNGAFFLAKIGLLANMPATTTAGFISSLKDFSPTTAPVYDKRFVDNGKIITTAGLTSGIDGAVHLIEKLDGPGWAKYIALGIEYNWQPDLEFSRASLADVKLPNSLGNVLSATSVPLDMHGTKTNWEEKWTIVSDKAATDVLAGIEKDWATETGWSKRKTDKSRTLWTLKEDNGKTWNGWAAVESSGETGKLIVTFGITADDAKIGRKLGVGTR